MTAPSDQLHQAATAYVQAGLSVIPTGSTGTYAKVPHSPALKAVGASYWDDVSSAIRGTWRPFQERQATPYELRTWFISMKASGIALVTGLLSGLIALDFDGQEGKTLLHTLGFEPHVITPSGGYHVYVRHPGWNVPTLASKSAKWLPKGLDIRGDGGLVMLPPTVLESGAYQRTAHKKVLPLAAIPREIRELTGLVPGWIRPETAVVATELAEGDRRPVQDLLEMAGYYALRHGRNQAGVVLAQQLFHHGYAEREARELAAEWCGMLGRTNTKGRAEAYTPQQFQATVRSVYRHWQGKAQA